MSTPSPLHAVHESADAFFLGYGPPESQIPVVETFGELDMEYALLRKGCVVFDEPHMGTIRITGSERHAFLNNMLTAKVDDLESGQSCFSFWLNRQGRIDADLRMIEISDSTVVRLDAHLVGRTVQSLDGFVFAEDVQITSDETTHWFSLHGPTAFDTLAKLADPITLSEHGNATITIDGVEVLVDRFDLTGEVGLSLGVPRDHAGTIYNALLAIDGVRPSGWLAINTARIEAGHPMYNIDFGPDTLPAESGLLESRVHLAKGCYLGQEVVARMHARNIRKQSVVGIRLDSQRISMEQQSVRQPMTGSQVFIKGQEGETAIGAVTSSTISPMLGAIPICFAMIKDAHTKAGSELRVWAEGAYADCVVNGSLAFWTKPSA